MGRKEGAAVRHLVTFVGHVFIPFGYFFFFIFHRGARRRNVSKTTEPPLLSPPFSPFYVLRGMQFGGPAKQHESTRAASSQTASQLGNGEFGASLIAAANVTSHVTF